MTSLNLTNFLGEVILDALQDRRCHRTPCPGVRVDQPPLRPLDLQLLVPEMFPDRVLQLPEGEYPLHDSCRSDGVSARDQSTGRIHRHRPLVGEVQAVLDILQERMSLLDEIVPLPIPAEPDVLVGLYLRTGVGVM